MLKPPKHVDTGRPFVPVAGSHEPAKPGSVRDELISYVERNQYVEDGSGGTNKSSPDSWKCSRTEGIADGRNCSAGLVRTRGHTETI